jgi:hypothetical protein
LAAGVVLTALATGAPARAAPRALPLPPSASPPPPPAPAVPAVTGAGDAPAPLVQVVTFGPGDHPFTRFGHDAIRILDPMTGADVIYNFGTFDIRAPHMISDFLKARLRYWLSRGPTGRVLAEYERENRSIVIQRLSLDPAQRRELARRLAENALPANRDYRYDYFHDNCSTRVRDAIDGVIGGRLHAVGRQPGTLSLRGHALRMAADNVPLYLALLIVLGPSTDRPLDRWGEAFLPEMLQATLRDVQLGGEGGDPDRPLVDNETTLFAARRAPPRPAPPRWELAFLAVGAAVGLALLGLGKAGARWLVARVAFGGVVALLGAVVGGVGTFLLYAWFITPHTDAHRNQNVLLFAPFALAALALGPAVAAGSRAAIRALWLLALATLASTAVACVLKLPGLPHQSNAPLILALAPVWLGLALGTRALAQSRPPATPSSP